jgi:putative ABC transport system substrate-binding protein
MKNVKKKITLLALCASLLAFCVSAQAQQAQKILRIGYLQVTASSPVAARTEAFRQGLRELGYVEGKNIVVEWRFAEGKADRLPSLAAELVRLKVDVIVTSGPTVTRSAKEATVTVPIVMTFDNDLLATGSLPALRDLAGTSLDCPRSRRR